MVNSSFIGLFNTTPFFAARPFLAVLLIALVARFSDALAAPSWLVSNDALLTVGALAFLEHFGTKTSLGRFLEEFTPLAKGVLNFLLVFILIFPLAKANSLAPVGLELLSFGLRDWTAGAVAVVGSFFTGGSVWLLAWLRNGILSALIDLDEEDDLGIQNYLSWIEDFWTISGTLAALFFPMLALAAYSVSLLSLFFMQRYTRYLQDKRKVACTCCGELHYATALRCPRCYQPNPYPHAVGLFGQALNRPAPNAAIHRYRLLARKRCSRCATRLRKRSIRQRCEACGKVAFAHEMELKNYLNQLRQDLPRTLAICMGLSFVPIWGILPGVIYYRLAFISSMRGYLQRPLVSCVRLLLLLFNLLLISLQWIPILGALVIPIIFLTNYWVYRTLLVRAGSKWLDRSDSNVLAEAEYAL